jgi:hypothetical protein
MSEVAVMSDIDYITRISIHFITRMKQRYNITLTRQEYFELNRIFSDKIPSSSFNIKIKDVHKYRDNQRGATVHFISDIGFLNHKNSKISCCLVFNLKYRMLITVMEELS